MMSILPGLPMNKPDQMSPNPASVPAVALAPVQTLFWLIVRMSPKATANTYVRVAFAR